MKYTATINGKKYTRNSKAEYKTAAAWVNKETGEVEGLTFSSKIARPTYTPFATRFDKYRKAFATLKEFNDYVARQKEVAKKWKVVTVELEYE